MVIDEVGRGEFDQAEGSYLLRVALYLPDREELHPIADVPFALDRGYWRWFPPISGDDDDEPTPRELLADKLSRGELLTGEELGRGRSSG